jgi:hypothetical protein
VLAGGPWRGAALGGQRPAPADDQSRGDGTGPPTGWPASSASPPAGAGRANPARIIDIITSLFADRLAQARAELDTFDDQQLADIHRFLTGSLTRHRTAAQHLRALPPASPARSADPPGPGPCP